MEEFRDLGLETARKARSNLGYLYIYGLTALHLQTRSNTAFSPWEIYLVKPEFDFEGKLKRQLEARAALEEAATPLNATNESDGLSDLSPLSSPCNTPPSTPPSSPLLPRPKLLLPCAAEPATSDLERRKARRKACRARSRNRKREEAAESYQVERVRKNIVERYVKTTKAHRCNMNLEKEANVSKSGYIGGEKVPFSSEIHSLKDLVGPGSKGFDLLKWDGLQNIALVDSRNRVIGLLAGAPMGEGWEAVAREAADAMEYWRNQCSFSKNKDKKGKRSRGDFEALACGVSYGGGQKKPTTIHNTTRNKEALKQLCGLECMRRISGFSTSVLATRAPKLHAYYASTMRSLYLNDPTLYRPFPRSVFAATTYNLGPRTVCSQHCDQANLIYGECSITPVGNFNSKTGGHLVLWDLDLVIEFPSGSTILIPSAVLSHSNTDILPHERRYSITQYSAGGLFRWVENGFMTAERRKETQTSQEIKLDKERDSRRWKEGIAMLPIIERKAP